MRLWLHSLVAWVAACSIMESSQTDIPPIDPMAGAIISVYAIDMRSQEVLLDTLSELCLAPASSLKLITTAAALHFLPHQNPFQTHLEYDGVISRGILKGNLYVVGEGDPCLGSGRVPGSLSWNAQLKAWAEQIRAYGIQRIEGSVIADTSLWEPELAVPSWAWEDIGNYYGAGASALSFHENAYSITFAPGKNEGDHTRVVKTDPPIPLIRFDNCVTTGPIGSGDRACIYGSEISSIQQIRGTVPAGVAEFTIRGAISDPASLLTELFTAALNAEKIGVGGKRFKQCLPRNRIGTTESPSLQAITSYTNHYSINVYAEHLLKKMGEVLYKEGSTRAGTRAVREFLRSQNIPTAGIRIEDGSGLSRLNAISAKQLVLVLQAMHSSPHYPLFIDSLSEGPYGVKAKSGSMTGIYCYAGYAKEIAFAIMINQCTDRHAADLKIAALIKELSSHYGDAQ